MQLVKFAKTKFSKYLPCVNMYGINLAVQIRVIEMLCLAWCAYVDVVLIVWRTLLMCIVFFIPSYSYCRCDPIIYRESKIREFTSKNITSPRVPYIYTHTRLTALFPGLPGWADTRKVNPIWFFLKQETVSVSVALAGPYASLHLAPDR